MKIAIFSDIHDNLERWQEAADIIKRESIDIGICCGDIQNIETLEKISQSFKKLYLAMGNADYALQNKTGLIPENIEWFSDFGEITLNSRKVAFVHNNLTAQKLADSKKYDLVFYGHTHTPWEGKVGKTIILNPGEICGRYGRPSFAIYDLAKMKAELKILK